MHRAVLLALAFAAYVAAVPTPVHTPPASVAAPVAPHVYYAMLADQNDAVPAAERAAPFFAQLERSGVRAKMRYSLDVLGAVSFELDGHEAERQLRALAARDHGLEGVTDLYPMLNMAPPRVITVDTKDPQLKFAHGITGVQEVHERYGLTGKGIKVGVIDSGIDYKHPALGGCLGKGCRVAYGYDFVGDDYDGRLPPIPGGDPRDHCNGHGTHVAGIIGAKDKSFVGVAPEATLGAYRVFGCKGSTANDIILAAMEKAYQDGMDVINMSLGGGSSWAQYPDSVLADKLTDKGMVVLAAMGNDGDKGAWMASSPGMTSKGFGVASFDNYRYMASGFHIDGTDPVVSMDYASSKDGLVLDFKSTEVGWGLSLDLEAIQAAQDDETAMQGISDEACKPISADLTGKIALVRRGACTFAEKAINAQNAGAVAVLVYNKEFGAFTPGVDDENVKIPVVGITLANGLGLLERMADGPVKITFDEGQQVYDNPTGGRPSGFSSWGPGPELEVKPDIGAPGGLIYSTYPLDMGAYSTLSGTSMATPYAAGSVALYLQHARGKGIAPRPVDPLEVRDVFKNTANPTTNLDAPEVTAPVQKQGAGLMNLLAAVRTHTRVSPAMLPLNATDVNGGAHGINRVITVHNKGKRTMSYTVSHRPAASIEPMDAESNEILGVPEEQEAYAKLHMSVTKFTLRGGESRRVDLRFQPPADLPADRVWLYGGYVVVEPTSSVTGAEAQPIISVPYAGMKGAYKKLGPLSQGLGYPAVIDGSTIKEIGGDDGESRPFSLKDMDTPFLMYRLARPCKKLIVKLLDAAKNDAELGVIPGGLDTVLGRHTTDQDDMLSVKMWDGTYLPDGSAPKPPFRGGKRMPGDPDDDSEPIEAPNGGRYRLRLMALKPMSDPRLVDSFQVWTSPEFSIDRTLEPPAPAEDETEANGDEAGETTEHRIAAKLAASHGARLLSALKLTLPSNDLDSVAASPAEVVRQRQEAVDSGVLPSPVKLPAPRTV